MHRLAILTNMVAPYRRPLYDYLGQQFETTVFVSGREGNRPTWIDTESPRFSVRRPRGFTFRWQRRLEDGIYDQSHLHLDVGLLATLWRDRPDAVVSVEMGFRSLVALSYGAIFGRPVWIWWGGTVHTEAGRAGIKKRVRRGIARRVPRWISYGRSSTEYLETLGVDPGRVLQIQNCVDETRYQAAPPPAFRMSPKPVVLYVGQFIRRKGVDRLLSAVARVQAQGVSMSLLLVGSGPEESALRGQARELELKDVHFEAPRRPESMPEVYRSADLFVLPTLEDVWGLVVNEALWSGVPVISSIHAGCTRELLPDSNRFDPLNLDDFAGCLKRALQQRISPADTTPLKPWREVGSMLEQEIRRGIEASR